jgi:hypothetical protein
MVNAVLVVETLRATSLPPHLFVLFVLFVVPARTLPSESFGVGCLKFSTSSKTSNTPPEWAGTFLRAFFALRKRSLPQVTPVEGGTSMVVTHREREGTGFPRNPIGVGFVVFSTKSKTSNTPPEWAGTLLRAFPSRLQAELATG